MSVSHSRIQPLLLVLPYALAGLLAPVLFSSMENPKDAGRITGFFFIVTGLYGLWLTKRWKMNPFFSSVYFFIVVSEICFWGWRFFAETPLKEFSLLGITGGMMHGFASGLYLLGGVILLYGAFFRIQAQH